MFNKRDDAPASPHQPAPAARRAPAGGFSVIGPDMVVMGNVRASADLHVEGRVEGDLDCGNLVLGAEASIQGQVRAESARVAGTIEGSVAIRQLVVESGARISGDVDYESISIENGAQIDGRLRHAANLKTAASSNPALTGPKELKIVDSSSDVAAA
ncbi:polymer-forming cytoskeletal protein [Sphingomonas sp.]|jgi:cytoskeletal protein CcmA (bactofilin family)|uniref:bactofilin family protein n=1 Tax=Sphingomonas sp. TaxID=28214 RepID=UPI002E3580F1|nr:polymer-forming cytoskeletal protein [Sphingomonas sp.]HEX4693070.1 polymer-forming cytoskeletal protein [Sphingomonas sp.]